MPALILARGGSKGIPGKNLKEVKGESLILRTATEAVKSLMDPVYVYSDSDSILGQAADSGGAILVSRPEEISGDGVSTEDTVKRFLRDEDSGGKHDCIAVLQCTTPFLNAEHLNLVVEKYNSDDYDSVLTATEFVRYLGYKGDLDRTEYIPVRPYRNLRQTDDPHIFMENGGCYLATRNLWLSGRRIGQKCGVVKMSWWESLEIDDPIDLEVARATAHVLER